MRHFAMFPLLLVFSCSACAKSMVGGGDGGSLRPLPGKHPPVRMESENIRITFPQSGGYTVLVDCVFRNEGASGMVAMGVPENNTFAPNPSRGLADLSIRVDGRCVSTHRRVINREGVQSPDYNILSVIRVPFRQRQRRHVRVRYRSQMWGSCGQFLAYLFAGNRWKGTVAHTSVTMVNGGGIYYSETGDGGVAAPSMPLRERGRLSHYQWNNWLPKGAFTVG